jgi:hypothetical protein
MRSFVSMVYVLGVSLVIAGCADDDEGIAVDAALPDAGDPPVDAAPPDDAGDGAFTVVLAGENEVPAVATPASGEAVATLDGDVLTVTGEFSDLEADLLEIAGSSAHIHEGDVDENGPVVFNLEVTPTNDRSGTLDGTFELTSEQLDLLEQGLLYVNIHTELNPAGELRGQLTPEQPVFDPVDAIFDAELLPENETHEVESDASGTATAILRGRDFTLSGQFAGLTSPLTAIEGSPAHVHEAPPDEDGPIAFNIEVVADEDELGGRLSITRTLTEEELDVLEAGDYYINIHTEDYPAGEIRGQLSAR